MKTRWIVQENLNTDNLGSICSTLEDLGYPYQLVQVIPFSDERPLTDPYDGPTIAYGSTTLIKSVPKEWVWYDEETFKPSVWGKKMGDKYLNAESEIMPLKQVMDRWKYSRQFIRPNSDLKLFSGAVFRNGDFFDWYRRLERLIWTGTYVNINPDTMVSVAPFAEINAEWRFFVADGRVLAYSQYRRNGKLDISATVIPQAYELVCDIASDEWQLAPAYVVDVAILNANSRFEDNEFKVIEFNNFNSSGFYMCNIHDIIKGASELAKRSGKQ